MPASEVAKIFGGTTRRFSGPAEFFKKFSSFVVSVDFNCDTEEVRENGLGVRCLVMLALYNNADWTYDQIRRKCVRLSRRFPQISAAVSCEKYVDDWRYDQIDFFTCFNNCMLSIADSFAGNVSKTFIVKNIKAKINFREKIKQQARRIEALKFLSKNNRLTPANKKELSDFCSF